MQPRLVVVFVLVSSLVFLQASSDKCVLDTNISSSWNGSDGNWDGFLNKSSCAQPFETYLFALAKEANKTGQIFLNITEQKDCSAAYTCGLDRLTSSTGGCSDYNVNDVVSEQGNALRSLDEGCKNLGTTDESAEEECSSCLRRWEQMVGSSDNGSITREEVEVCRFSVLVSLTSRRINDLGWMQSIYKCLGDGTPIADDQARDAKKTTFIRDIEVLAGGVAGISTILGIVWLALFKKRKNRKPPRDNVVSQESSGAKISIREVLLATDNLSASNFIGQGVAGKVYKGVLSNGQRVAVKHIVNDGHMETFVREVTSLSHVKHPNLVELLGHCDGEDESFLVYELCDNGNLSEWLFGKQKFLTWIQRLEIAIDCAKGLCFLHTYPEGCIVHRDIKPTNILLGSKFEGKVCDFGLSKVMSMGLSHVSSEVRGTFGYVDPEYQMNRLVHSSSDVYSFGVVLLQILSGQRVINLELTKPMPLSKMAKNLRRGGDLREFADPKLNGEYSMEAFRMVFKLALLCTDLKQRRPSMEKVVTVLQKAHLISATLNSFDSSFQSL